MKKTLLIFILLLARHACFAYPLPHPFPPFRIAGNLYYVGTDDLTSYLIVTPKGNILINSELEANVPMIKSSIEKLGFKFSDTKILLISHAHFDHAAGSHLIKQQTNSKYMVMDADASDVESGGRTNFNYAHDPSTYFPKTIVDKILHDGDRIELGGTTLIAHLTAGHTPGCTSWEIRLKDHGKQYKAIIIGSLSVNPGYQLIHNKTYPNILHDYQHAIKVLKALHGDIFLASHAGMFDLQKKYTLLNKTKSNPFIDPQAYEKYIAKQEVMFNRELAKQAL